MLETAFDKDALLVVEINEQGQNNEQNRGGVHN